MLPAAGIFDFCFHYALSLSATHEDAQDAAQEAAIAVWRWQVRPTHANVAVITRQRLYSRHRWERLRASVTLKEEDIMEEPVDETALAALEARLILETLALQAPEALQLAWSYAFDDGPHTGAERVRIHRARRKLRSIGGMI